MLHSFTRDQRHACCIRSYKGCCELPAARTCNLVAGVHYEHCQPQAPVLWRCAHDARNVTQEGGLAGAGLAQHQQGLRPIGDGTKEATNSNSVGLGVPRIMCADLRA